MGHTTKLDLNKEVPIGDLKLDTTEQKAAYTEVFKKEPIQAEAKLVSVATAAAKEAEKDQSDPIDRLADKKPDPGVIRQVVHEMVTYLAPGIQGRPQIIAAVKEKLNDPLYKGRFQGHEEALLKALETTPLPGEITIDQFAKIKLQVGTVYAAERVEGADKLIKLSVDLGESSPRQIVAGIGLTFKPEDLVGKQYAFVTNLPPRKLRGVESQGMILATGEPDKLTLVQLTGTVPNGSQLG